jgi:DNA-binding transcriptional LysR family regulator
MDRFDAMAVLLAVIEEGSLSAGARRLRSPLTTVSRKVAELEQHLGTRLLVRTSRRVELTDAGRDYVDASRRILEQVEEAERAASGEYSEPRGELSLTAPVVFGRRHVLPIAAEFLAEYPSIDLRMLLIDRQVNLLEEHLDIGVRLGHLEDSSLMATRVGQIHRVVCASPDYLARKGSPMVPEDLRDHDGITFRGFSTSPEWRYRGDGAALSVEPRTRLAVNSSEAAIEAAIAGVGIARVLSYQIVDELRAKTLVPLLEAFAPEPIPVQLVYAAQGRLPVKVRSFLDWTAPRLRARLTDLSPKAG